MDKTIMKKTGHDTNLINVCYKCKSKTLKPKKNLITLGNKFAEINVLECQNCGESFSTMGETERARKILNPSIINRIISWFGSFKAAAKDPNIFRDKIL